MSGHGSTGRSVLAAVKDALENGIGVPPIYGAYRYIADNTGETTLEDTDDRHFL
jgi:hypothetical protein